MRLFTVSEFAEEIGKTAQTLRNWDKKGEFQPAYKGSNGWRYYTEAQLKEYNNRISNIVPKTTITYVKDTLEVTIHTQTHAIKQFIKEKGINKVEEVIENQKYYELSHLKLIVDDMLQDKVKSLIVYDKSIIFNDIFVVLLQIIEQRGIEIIFVKNDYF